MRSSHPVRRCVAAVTCAAVVAMAGCSSGVDNDSADENDGVILSVVPDLTGAPADAVFAAVPDLLVIEDGRVIYAAPDEFAISGALMRDVWVQTLSPAGVQRVRDAVAVGEPPQDIAELSVLVGSALSDVRHYLPETFRFAAIQIGPAAGLNVPDMPLIDWPATASIALADATECTRLPELEVGEAFVTAAEDSAFLDDGIVYGVVAAPDWPGAPCTLPD